MTTRLYELAPASMNSLRSCSMLMGVFGTARWFSWVSEVTVRATFLSGRWGGRNTEAALGALRFLTGPDAAGAAGAGALDGGAPFMAEGVGCVGRRASVCG